MGRLWKTSLVLLAFSVVSSVCQAGLLKGVQPGVRGGYHGDNEDFFLGVDAKFGVLTVNANPSIEYVFVSDGTAIAFNADGFVSVLKLPAVTGWVGAGIGWMYVNPEAGDSSTDSIINLIAGVELGVPLAPYLMVKWILDDKNDGFVVGAGIRF